MVIEVSFFFNNIHKTLLEVILNLHSNQGIPSFQKEIKRVILVFSAIFLLIGIVWLLPVYVFDIVFSVLAFFAFVEFYTLNCIKETDYILFCFGIILGLLLVLQPILFPNLPGIFPIALILVLILSFTILRNMSLSAINWQQMAIVIFGIIYLGIAFGYVLVIRHSQLGRQLITILFFAIWARELGAGIGGRIFPNSIPISKSINERKSWLGAFVGLLTSTGMIWITSHITSIGFTLSQIVILGVILSIGCQFGDLSESFLKRISNVRHSSNKLGTQGGVLDTIDALIFAAIIMYAFLNLYSLL